MVIKKLIAISVVFALVAGAAFAVDIGGTVIAAVDVVNKQGGVDDVGLLVNGHKSRVRLEGSGEAEIGIGTIGGWLRYDLDRGAFNSWGPKEDGPMAAYGFYGKAWWQPIEQLRIQLGANPDGEFETSHIGRYGFYAQANEINALINEDGNWGSTSYDSGIFGGYSAFNFALIITPMDGVSINVALPWNVTPTGTDKPAAATFKQVFFQVNYAADFGSIHITYQGKNEEFNITSAAHAQMGKFFASAFLGSLVEGLQLEFGVGFGIAAKDALKSPLGIALGVRYDVSEQFGVKLRSIFDIPMQSGEKVAVRVDVLPFYAINESVTAYFDAGIYLTGADKQFAFHFAPYVRIGSEWGPGFYAGLKIDNGGGVKDVDKVNFAIPVGIIAQF